jgi:HAD superfamily hydrolase (TIGR01549 family)
VDDKRPGGAALGVSAVVFDMDGTLFDSTACVTMAYREAVLAAGGPDCSPPEVVAAYPLGPPAAILSHLLGREATPQEESVYLAFLDKYQDRIEVYDGVTGLLAALASEGVPLAVFTGASRAAASRLLAATELLPYFSALVGGDDVSRTKPEPDGIFHACDLLDVAPSRVAYVGDSTLDLEAARRSGALAVAAAWGHLFDAEASCDVLARTPHDVLSIVGTAH